MVLEREENVRVPVAKQLGTKLQPRQKKHCSNSAIEWWTLIYPCLDVKIHITDPLEIIGFCLEHGFPPSNIQQYLTGSAQALRITCDIEQWISRKMGSLSQERRRKPLRHDGFTRISIRQAIGTIKKFEELPFPTKLKSFIHAAFTAQLTFRVCLIEIAGKG